MNPQPNFDNPDLAYLNQGKRKGELIPGGVPAAPKAAAAFFKDNLPPPGVFAVYDQQHNLYTLNYGYRLKVSDAQAAQVRAARAVDQPARAAQLRGITDGIVNSQMSGVY